MLKLRLEDSVNKDAITKQHFSEPHEIDGLESTILLCVDVSVLYVTVQYGNRYPYWKPEPVTKTKQKIERAASANQNQSFSSRVSTLVSRSLDSR